MKKTLLLIPIILLIVSCNSGSFPVEPKEKEIERVFTKNIERIYSSNFESDLIFKAESVYPNRDSVLATVSPFFPQSSIPDSNLWFYDSFDGILIPFAITAESILYYSNLIDSMSANNGYNFFLKANFKYNAEIEFKTSYTFVGKNPQTDESLPSISFERVYVVDMTLDWDNYCGIDCAMWISHKRIVVFDEFGNLLNIFYDCPFPVMVS